MSSWQTYLENLLNKIRENGRVASRLGVVGTFEHLLQLDEYNIDLAYTILLVNVASIDNDFAPRESYFIKQKIQQQFDLTYDESEALMNEAKAIVDKDDRDLKEFGTYLRQHLPHSRREELLSIVDKLISEDKVNHPFEKHLRNKYAKWLALDKV